MKIAMVSEHASPLEQPGAAEGGEQNVHVAELAAALVQQGHAVTVYTRRTDAGADEVVDTPAGYRVEHLRGGEAEPLPAAAHLPVLPEFASRLSDRLAENPPDVVHAHFWTSGMVSLAATKTSGVPVVQTFHSLGVTELRHSDAQGTSPPGRPQMEQVIAASAARTIATSKAEQSELLRMGVPRSSLAVVPCGVDTERFAPGGPSAQSPPRVLGLGRLVPHKGFDLIVRALRRVPGVELWIGGGGITTDLDGDPEAIRLRGLAERVGVADRVRLLGQVARAEVPGLLRSARVVTATPWYESFGLVPLEAMACGAPVLASAVGGHLDTVVDGVTGRLVPPGRADLVAVSLNRLLDDPVQLDAFGVAGADRARSRYSWQRIAADTVRVYHAATGTPMPEENVGAPFVEPAR